MTVRLKVDGTTGTVAIYDYTIENDEPFTNPYSHLSRLHFHSNLPAIKVVDVRTGSTTLAALNSGINYNITDPTTWYPGLTEAKTLFAHGQAGVPYCEGRITSLAGSPVNIPLTGSVPIQRVNGYPRWLHLGADATNVILNAFVNGSVNGNYASVAVNWEVYVTDMVL